MVEKKPIIALILYRADDSAYCRMKVAVDEGYRLFIFDNFPSDKSKCFADKYRGNIRYFTFEKNVGIGPALKLLCSKAYEEQNPYLLYFDQDTVYDRDTLKFICEYLNVSSERIIYNVTEKLLSVTFRDGTVKRKEKCSEKIFVGRYELHIVDLTINSGTLFYLKNLKKVGWHDESYTMDGVDYYMCLAAKIAGLSVAEIYNTPGLDHMAEQGAKVYKFLFKRYVGRKYPVRRIQDYLRSSLKLVIKSFLIETRISLRIIRLLMSYLLIQVFIYLADEEKQERS